MSPILSLHDDVIKLKKIPRYWPFVQGIYRSPLKPPAQRPGKQSFDIFFEMRL